MAMFVRGLMSGMGIACLCASLSGDTSSVSEDALTRYYLPHATEVIPDLLERLAAKSKELPYWRSPQQISAQRAEGGSPLSGLRIVLDPGHIGGDWAMAEARNFRIQPDDFWVREGELVLEVAELVKTDLEDLGAEVWLTRDSADPVNARPPSAYLSSALKDVERPLLPTIDVLRRYALDVYDRATRLAAVTGDIAARAKWINEIAQPDVVVSLHINAGAWPDADNHSLIESNHLHVLIFGCLSLSEYQRMDQQSALRVKLLNQSGPVEREIGLSLAVSLREATQLSASHYDGQYAVPVAGSENYLWARNLMFLRLVECPVALLEPYVANSQAVYPRIQSALRTRATGQALAENDILVEYAEGVVQGIRNAYSSK